MPNEPLILCDSASYQATESLQIGDHRRGIFPGLHLMIAENLGEMLLIKFQMPKSMPRESC